jgi:hypothetical protein
VILRLAEPPRDVSVVTIVTIRFEDWMVAYAGAAVPSCLVIVYVIVSAHVYGLVVKDGAMIQRGVLPIVYE